MTSVVKYRYPGEDYQFVDGDDYKLDLDYANVTSWQATGEATSQLPGTEGQKVRWFTEKTFSVPEGTISSQVLKQANGAPVGRYWTFPTTPCKFYSSLVGQWWLKSASAARPRLLTAFYPSTLYEYRHPPYDFENKTDYYSEPVITYWHPVNGDIIYTFRVFNNGSETFSRTEINKRPNPIIIQDKKQCSSNLCPVLCGANICCYNNQGISEESFLQVESIY